MVQTQQLERVSPEVGEWLANLVLSCDESVRAMMLVNDRGQPLVHARAQDFENFELECVDDASLLVRIPGLQVTAFLRIDSRDASRRVYEKVSRLIGMPEGYISP